MIEFVVQHEDMDPDMTGYESWIVQVADLHEKNISEITYILTTDQEVLHLNQQYLDHDYYTDILTFERTEGALLSGDVYISLDRVRENAKKFDVSFDEELRRVMIHGLLHMIGYSDSEQEEKKKIRVAENEALELFHVKQ